MVVMWGIGGLGGLRLGRIIREVNKWPPLGSARIGTSRSDTTYRCESEDGNHIIQIDTIALCDGNLNAAP